MAKLKSKNGCLTCLARKKKCDEVKPTCGNCKRLNIACQGRVDQVASSTTTVAIKQTNLKARGLAVPLAMSNEIFKTALEKDLSMKSTFVLKPMVSRMADPVYEDTKLFTQFCIRSPLVRHALIAFQAYFIDKTGDECLKSYQKCVKLLQQAQALQSPDPADMDHTLVAICFLGLLEGLRLGDPTNTIRHFEACRSILIRRLKLHPVLEDEQLAQVYRQVAECIIYNVAALSPYVADVLEVATDWGSDFEGLLPAHVDRLSPFLGGFSGLYHVMFQTIILLRQTQTESGKPSHGSAEAAYRALWQQLDDHERSISSLYRHRPAEDDGVQLYRSKYAISINALRIHLIKIARPSTTLVDPHIQLYLARSIAIIEQQSIVEPRNPALVWPLTILACAAYAESDFVFVTANMLAVADEQVDPANKGRLYSAVATLRQFRANRGTVSELPLNCTEDELTSQLDFLLEPRNLLEVTTLDEQPRIAEVADDPLETTSMPMRPAVIDGS